MSGGRYWWDGREVEAGHAPLHYVGTVWWDQGARYLWHCSHSHSRPSEAQACAEAHLRDENAKEVADAEG